MIYILIYLLILYVMSYSWYTDIEPEHHIHLQGSIRLGLGIGVLPWNRSMARSPPVTRKTYMGTQTLRFHIEDLRCQHIPDIMGGTCDIISQYYDISSMMYDIMTVISCHGITHGVYGIMPPWYHTSWPIMVSCIWYHVSDIILWRYDITWLWYHLSWHMISNDKTYDIMYLIS